MGVLAFSSGEVADVSAEEMEKRGEQRRMDYG